jgi:hypothetical protein
MISCSMPSFSLNVDRLEEIEGGRPLLAQQPAVSSGGDRQALYSGCIARFITDAGKLLQAERFHPSVLHRHGPRAFYRADLIKAPDAQEEDPAAVPGCSACGDHLKDGSSWISITGPMEEPIGAAPMHAKVDA